MTRPNLQIAPTEPAKPLTMDEAIMAAARVCAAAMPCVAMIVWEVNGKVIYRSVPESLVLQKGMADALFAIFYPPDGE